MPGCGHAGTSALCHFRGQAIIRSVSDAAGDVPGVYGLMRRRRQGSRLDFSILFNTLYRERGRIWHRNGHILFLNGAEKNGKHSKRDQ